MHGVKGSGTVYEPKNGLSWWYQRLAHHMVTYPNKTKKEIAQDFDVTPQTIYMVTNSQSFKTYYAQLMQDQEQAIAGIAEKTAAVTEMALDHLIDKLAAPGAQECIPVMQLQDISHKGLTALGYGVPKAPQVQVNNIGGITVQPGELAAARAKYEEKFGDTSTLALPAPSPAGPTPKALVEAE